MTTTKKPQSDKPTKPVRKDMIPRGTSRDMDAVKRPMIAGRDYVKR